MGDSYTSECVVNFKKFGKGGVEKMASVIDTKFTKPLDNTRVRDLSYKEVRFIDEYMIIGDKIQAMKNAGFNGTDDQLRNSANRIMAKPEVKEEMLRRQEEIQAQSVLSAREILELYTKIANGEVLDQFGLDASLKDRIAAMKELAKYQIELPMKLAAERNNQDNNLTIKLIRE